MAVCCTASETRGLEPSHLSNHDCDGVFEEQPFHLGPTWSEPGIAWVTVARYAIADTMTVQIRVSVFSVLDILVRFLRS